MSRLGIRSRTLGSRGATGATTALAFVMTTGGGPKGGGGSVCEVAYTLHPASSVQ